MNVKKLIRGLLFGVAACVTLAFGVACDASKSVENEYTGFLEGVATKTKLAETVLLEDIIDYVDDGEYKIELDKEGWDEPLNLTRRASWTPDEPGLHTFTHTVLGGENAGVYTHDIYVTTAIMEWTHSTDPFTLLYDTEVSFEEIYKELNLAVETAFEWTPFIKNVRIKDELIPMAEGATSYRITSLDTHYFTFGVLAADGQKLMSVATANIVYSESATDLYLNDACTGTHAISVYGAQSVEINGEPCTDVSITPTGISFLKKTLYDKYPGINFISIKTANGEVRETLNVFTETYSFEGENAAAPSFITAHGSNLKKEEGTKSISDKYVTDGKKSLEILTSTYYWPRIIIQMDYLDMIFENEDVTALTFDMTYAGSEEAHTQRDLTFNARAMTVLYSKQPNTIEVTREAYDKIVANNKSYKEKEAAGTLTSSDSLWYGLTMTLQNTRNAVGGLDSIAHLYFDNFQTVYALDSDTLSAAQTATGTYDIEISGVSAVTVNGAAISEGKVTVAANKVSIDKAWLLTNVGANLVELQVGNRKYQKTVNVYQTSYDFENDTDVSRLGFIYWYSGATSPTTEIVDYNGSKALRMYTKTGQWPRFVFSAEWLDLVFADKKVASVEFDMLLDNCGNEAVTYRYFTSNAIPYTQVKAGESTTITITREKYDAAKTKALNEGTAFEWVDVTMMNQAEHPGGTVQNAWIIDNVRSVGYKNTDFETKNQSEGSFLLWPSESVTCNRSIIEFNGSYAYRMHLGRTSYPKFIISAAWLENRFADETVTAITFDFAIIANKEGNFTYREMTSANGAVPWVRCQEGEVNKLTLTRESYEAWLDSDKYDERGLLFMVQQSSNTADGGIQGMGLIFDNFVLVRETAE